MLIVLKNIHPHSCILHSPLYYSPSFIYRLNWPKLHIYIYILHLMNTNIASFIKLRHLSNYVDEKCICGLCCTDYLRNISCCNPYRFHLTISIPFCHNPWIQHTIIIQQVSNHKPKLLPLLVNLHSNYSKSNNKTRFYKAALILCRKSHKANHWDQ